MREITEEMGESDIAGSMRGKFRESRDNRKREIEGYEFRN